MKEIKIKKIHLENFKGVKDLEIEFGAHTDICGGNATGKTTVFDAFTWCLFGKDSQDRTDSGRGAFGIKGTDENGNIVNKLDHSVTLTLDINGVNTTLKRVMAEKWVTKDGSTDVEFKGNETHCYWNDVELKISEYAKRIAEEIIDDNRFKAITNPKYVCNLPWEKQKAILADLIGDVTYADVVGENADFLNELNVLESKNMLGREDEYSKSMQSSVRKMKEDIKAYTQQVIGMKGMLPDEPDINALNIERDEINRELEIIEDKRRSQASKQSEAFKAVKEVENKITDAKQKIVDFKLATVDRLQEEYRSNNESYFKASNELESIRRSSIEDLSRKNKQISDLEVKKMELERELEILNGIRDRLLDEWKAENEKEFDANNNVLMCPLYNRVCDSNDAKVDFHNKRVEMERSFYETKEAKLAKIEDTGNETKASIDDYSSRLGNLVSELDNLKQDYIASDKSWQTKISEARLKEIELGKAMGERPTESNIDWSGYTEIEDLNNEIAELQKRRDGISVGSIDVDNEDLARRSELKARSAEIDEQFGAYNVILEQREKIHKLEDNVADMTQNLATLEQEIDILSQMRKAVDIEIQRRCDVKFRFVKWKLSEVQINGGETATCYAMADGVRYSDQNTAMQVNMGLDIINALCKHYDVNVPIFIDNAETVNKLEDTNSQMVRLVVTNDKKLKIQHS